MVDFRQVSSGRNVSCTSGLDQAINGSCQGRNLELIFLEIDVNHSNPNSTVKLICMCLEPKENEQQDYWHVGQLIWREDITVNFLKNIAHFLILNMSKVRLMVQVCLWKEVLFGH